MIEAGRPLMLAVSCLYEDPSNPRTEVPEAELDELAEDIRQHGILQPIVVHPADGTGRYRIHFGSKRWRAAQRVDMQEVPVVVRDAPADPYTQVAENQKRHGLTPFDLARFIRGQVDAGDSNATVAKRLGMNLTAVAHHLALLELPPELDEAMKSGRCTSPRTLHELSKLHNEQPEQVRALVAGDADITRSAVSSLRLERKDAAVAAPPASPSNKLIAQANAACDRLERALGRVKPPAMHKVALAELVALRVRVADLANRWLQGSDRQTP
ncbi:MAG TPA: ParB/RepB/Spo0J family partition protein [Burkholderiaceae bacterium]